MNFKQLLEKKMIENQHYIKSVPVDYLDEITDVIVKGAASEKGLKDIIDNIKDVYDMSNTKAKDIARNGIGKLNSALTEARSRSLGLSSYEWHCMFRDNSRDTHEELDGMIIDYDNPPQPDDWEDPGHAGELKWCYCWQNPVVLKESEDPIINDSELDDGPDDRTDDGGVGIEAASKLRQETK